MMDRLSELPGELLNNVLSHFRCVYLDQPDVNAHTLLPNNLAVEPLYALAACSTHFRSSVDSHCEHMLTRYKRFTNFKPIKSKPKIPYRVRWVKWVDSHCAFCGKNTVCKALFNKDISCCKKCHKKKWDMMTMTEALMKYRLTKLDLFTPNPLYDDRFVDELPELRFATYDCVGVETTMFLTDQLSSRAQHIHGPVSEAEQTNRKKDRHKILALLEIKWSPYTYHWYRDHDFTPKQDILRQLILTERSKIRRSCVGSLTQDDRDHVDFNRAVLQARPLSSSLDPPYAER